MIQIRPFESAYTEDVIAFILHIQQKEFGLPVTREQQPDLARIPQEYQQAQGNFWIASDEGKLIGTIALTDLGNGNGALRKMFVHEDYRGPAYGLAKQLLDTLLTWAKAHAFTNIYLGTADILKAAHRFYEKNGFAAVQRADVPDGRYIMPVDTRFYHLAL